MIKHINTVLRMGTRIVFHNFKILLLMWVFNIAYSIIITYPIFQILKDDLNNSVISEILIYRLDYSWFVQFLIKYESFLTQIPFTIVSLSILYFFINTFFTGGLLSIYSDKEKNDIVDFFYGGVKNWTSLVKLNLLLLLFVILMFTANNYLEDLFSGLSKNLIIVYFQTIKYLLILFSLMFFVLFFDYMKIYAVLKKERKIKTLLKVTFQIFKNNFIVIGSVYLMVSLISLVLILFYHTGLILIPGWPYYFLILSFILQQIILFLRFFVRVLFYSTEVLIFQDITADIIIPKIIHG